MGNPKKNAEGYADPTAYAALAPLAAAVFLLVQFAGMTIFLCNYFHSEGARSDMVATLEDGPLAGLRTSQNRANYYHRVLFAVKEAGPSSEDSVMIAPVQPYAYFILNCEVAAPSAWTSAREMNEPKIAEYFALNPSKWPDWILIPVDEIGDNEREISEFIEFAEQNDYSELSRDDTLIVLRRET